jgi:hypothetical protein
MSQLRRGLGVGLLGGALALVAGCKKQEQPPQAAPEASASAQPAVDNKIANAVKAAAQQAQQGGQATGKSADDLPANGLLTVEQADAKAARGGFNSITLGSTGSEPRLRLGSSAASTLKGKLELAVRTGPRSAMPTVVLDLEGSTKVEAGPSPTALKVSKSQLGNEQPGRIPDDVAEAITKLKGSSFSTTLLPTGRGALKFEAPATLSHSEYEALLAAAAETLETVWLSYPSEPIGVGGYWMVRSRETFYQGDVVVFRLVKVESIQGQQAQLSVATKRYLVGNVLGQMGLPPHTVAQYDGSGEAKMVVSAGAALPDQCEINDNLAAAVALHGNQAQQVPLQVGLQARFTGAR